MIITPPSPQRGVFKKTKFYLTFGKNLLVTLLLIYIYLFFNNFIFKHFKLKRHEIFT